MHNKNYWFTGTETWSIKDKEEIKSKVELLVVKFQTRDQSNKEIVSWISSWLVNVMPLMRMVLAIRCELANQWKNLEFLSPSLSHKAWDFCLQQIYSIRITFSNPIVMCSLFPLSTIDKGLESATSSRSLKSIIICFFCKDSCPNSTSFHFFLSQPLKLSA